MPKATIAHHGVDGINNKGTENLRSLALPDGPYYIDHVTKGGGRDHYCLTYGSKVKRAFTRIEEEGRDTVFLLCDAELGRFETYILASEVRTALETEQVKITLPGYTPDEAKRFSRECSYPASQKEIELGRTNSRRVVDSSPMRRVVAAHTRGLFSFYSSSLVPFCQQMSAS